MSSYHINRNNTSFPVRLYEHFKHAQWGSEYGFLKYYQNITREYTTNVDSGARGLLAYYTMGLGKSILAVAIAMDQIKERQPIILLTKSLQDNMKGAIRKYVRLRRAAEPDYPIGRLSDPELESWIEKNFSFVSMNASNMLGQMNKAAKGTATAEFDAMLENRLGEVLKLPSLDGKLLIIDEAHNFFRAITNGSKNAVGLYNMTMKAVNLRLLFLTGTPINNDPFELVPCFNMLAGGAPILPEAYAEFNKLYVGKDGQLINKEKFQNRLFGLVSHVTATSEPGRAFGINDPASRAVFPTAYDMKVIYVNMEPYQYTMYQLARDKERDEGKGGHGRTAVRQKEPPNMTKPKSNAASTYRVKSRQLSNYCPPPGHMGETDMNKIPLEQRVSAKADALMANLDKHRGQTGIVYSQFVGIGGLGSISAALDSRGWRRLELPARIGGADENINGPAILSADSYLNHIESELISHEIHAGREFSLEFDESDKSAEAAAIKSSQPRTICSTNSTRASVPTLMSRKPDVLAPDAHGARTDSADGARTDDDKIKPNKAPSHYISFENHGDYVTVHRDGKLVGHVVISDGKITESDVAGAKVPVDDLLHTIMSGSVVVIIGSAEDAAVVDTAGVHIDINRPRTYAVISGDVSLEERQRIQDIFNSPENSHGELLDLILLSSTGAEGLDLKRGRHVHIYEPYWNYSRINQIIFRLVRNDSHTDMPAPEQNVQPYIYLAVPPLSERGPNGEYVPTTDTELYEESLHNMVAIETFINALKEVSIECMVNAEEYCRKCNPTNAPLYTDDPVRDIYAADPCQPLYQHTVKAKEIIVDGTHYYYTKDDDALFGYIVFIMDNTIGGYRPLPESAPEYEKIVASIAGAATTGGNMLINEWY